MNEVTACRAVLIEVLTILAKDLDKVWERFKSSGGAGCGVGYGVDE